MAPEPMEEGPTTQHPAEGPNDDAKKFYKMIDDVDKPLYEGCTKFTIFSAIVVTTRKTGYCGGSEPPLKPQKPPLKVH